MDEMEPGKGGQGVLLAIVKERQKKEGDWVAILKSLALLP